MKKLFSLTSLALLFTLSSCSENYSNGERIGLITQFSHKGMLWKSWEGHLNVTQTGMNSSIPFDFSIDNDNEDEKLVKTLDSAAIHGYKVKLVYHETFGKNWLGNRGATNHFVTKCEVLDRNFANSFNGNNNNSEKVTGKVIDTIYVVIDRTK